MKIGLKKKSYYQNMSSTQQQTYQSFDTSFKRLLLLCKDIVKKKKDTLKLNLDEKEEQKCTAILKSVERYDKLYTKTAPNNRNYHCKLFVDLYQTIKSQIMSDQEINDTWLQKKDVVIEIIFDRKSNLEFSIPVGKIYLMAIVLRNEATKKVTMKEYEELLYPDRFLLYLFRIFKSLSTKDGETTKLETHIETLEKNLGLNNPSGGSNSLQGINSIIGMANTMLHNSI